MGRQFLSFLLVGLVAQVYALNTKAFENTAIVRTVDLGGAVVHVTTTYAVKATEAGAKTYTIAVDQLENEKTSWYEAKIKGQQGTLEIKHHALEPSRGYHLIDVQLPKALAANASLNIVLDATQTHVTYPWPQEVSQSEEQALKYDTKLFVLSPYFTAVQRTKLKALQPRIIGFTTPKNVEDYTFDTPATKSGATVTYGPYNNVPSSANQDFVESNQQTVTVHYNHDQPVLEIRDLQRTAEVSHWGANLNIEDKMTLFNAGPALKGHFSRLEHQSQAFFQRMPSHILPALSFHLPPAVRNTYYYDLVGNVSTSRLRVSPPSPVKNARPSILELRPRFPLLGGWNYSLTMGWDTDLGDNVGYDKASGKYILQVPIITGVPGAVVNNAEVRIILPEGATDVDFETPFPALTNKLSTHKTYLDSVGRPMLSFEYKDLISLHAQSIYVSYRVPITAHLRKPAVVGWSFFAVFVFGAIAKRVDLRLNKNGDKEKEKTL